MLHEDHIFNNLVLKGSLTKPNSGVLALLEF